MKVVLFCGGLGSRMREYSAEIPKPLVPLKGRPIMCHIMDYYARFGHTEFILCLGYKGDTIRRYFESTECAEAASGKWRVTCVDTGLSSTIGERLAKVASYVRGDEMFLANYADGLTDFEMPLLIDRIKNSNAVAGFLSVVPTHSFHFAETRPDGVVTAMRNAIEANLRMNGGFFVLRPAIFDVLHPGEEMVEAPFGRLIERGQLVSMVHEGFWRCIDTLKDLKTLENWLDDQERDGRHYINLPTRQLDIAQAG